jgi:hypothetical protein
VSNLILAMILLSALCMHNYLKYKVWCRFHHTSPGQSLGAMTMKQWQSLHWFSHSICMLRSVLHFQILLQLQCLDSLLLCCSFLGCFAVPFWIVVLFFSGMHGMSVLDSQLDQDLRIARVGFLQTLNTGSLFYATLNALAYFYMVCQSPTVQPYLMECVYPPPVF